MCNALYILSTLSLHNQIYPVTPSNHTLHAYTTHNLQEAVNFHVKTSSHIYLTVITMVIVLGNTDFEGCLHVCEVLHVWMSVCLQKCKEEMFCLCFWPRELHKSIKALMNLNRMPLLLCSHIHSHTVVFSICISVRNTMYKQSSPLCSCHCHIRAGLLNYFPTFFSATNCKCEELCL